VPTNISSQPKYTEFSKYEETVQNKQKTLSNKESERIKTRPSLKVNHLKICKCCRADSQLSAYL